MAADRPLLPLVAAAAAVAPPPGAAPPLPSARHPSPPCPAMAADARIVKQRLRALLRTVDFETETQVWYCGLWGQARDGRRQSSADTGPRRFRRLLPTLLVLRPARCVRRSAPSPPAWSRSWARHCRRTSR